MSSMVGTMQQTRTPTGPGSTTDLSDRATVNDRSRPAISVQALTRRFGDQVAVDDLDLDVESGEIYGLLGPNGAGKSTTVRMLCTLLAPTSGTATVAGHSVTSAATDVRLRIGVALQDAALDPRQTGSELIRLQGRLFGFTRVEADRRLGELAEVIELGDALDRPVSTYSGGMRRRLDLAVALVNNPDVLFLDEPTTGLDPASRHQIWAEVRRLNRDLGTTILLTTQYLEEADTLADRVGIMNNGHLVLEGTPADLKRSVGTDVIVARVVSGRPSATSIPDALAAITGIGTVEAYDEEVVISVADGAAAIGPVAIALDTAGFTVANLALRTPTLDDVFLDVTGSRLGSERDQTPAYEPANETREIRS